MRIGILGGSFNPPHIGHLILAEYVKEKLKLNKVIFVPCNIPPHKVKSQMVSAKLRLQMLKLAVRKNKDFQVSDLEIRKGGISYSADTLKLMKKIYPEDKLFFIIGSDLYNEFSQWHKPEEIKKLAQLVVVERLAIKIREPGVIFLNIPKIDISSSLIRERIKKGLSVRYLVPEEVRIYISRKKLYK